jgi:hypothetical protein
LEKYLGRNDKGDVRDEKNLKKILRRISMIEMKRMSTNEKGGYEAYTTSENNRYR